jgi:hypothetical protein
MVVFDVEMLRFGITAITAISDAVKRGKQYNGAAMTSILEPEGSSKEFRKN